jgi:O-glycosyl hydrolase
MIFRSRRARFAKPAVPAGAAVALAVALAAGASACSGAASSQPGALPQSPLPRPVTAQVAVDPGQVDQPIDGFGFAEAFREPVITALPASAQQRLGALLFSPRTGAGMSIVRFGLGGPTDPADHISGPGDVADQVWLGKLAEQFGVSQFYADAWSAPAHMKTNGSIDNGGFLCDVPGVKCKAGDFRAAYASYLTAQAKGFAEHGIPLEAVGFVNEPEIGPSYASMLMIPAQAASFVPFLGRALAAAHLPAKVACCDTEGWDDAEAYTQAVLGDPAAARYIGLITSHGYSSAPTVPLTSARHVWETEWADFGRFDPAWDDGANGDGLTWAQYIQTALTKADVNAFFYWWGAFGGKDNSGLIRLKGSTITLSKRYWAFAAFGRYIRPGAVRVGATSSVGALDVSAFRNRDGSQVIEILNTGTTAAPISLKGLPAGHLSAYLTGDSEALTPLSGPLTAPARSLLTVVISK